MNTEHREVMCPGRNSNLNVDAGARFYPSGANSNLQNKIPKGELSYQKIEWLWNLLEGPELLWAFCRQDSFHTGTFFSDLKWCQELWLAVSRQPSSAKFPLVLLLLKRNGSTKIKMDQLFPLVQFTTEWLIYKLLVEPTVPGASAKCDCHCDWQVTKWAIKPQQNTTMQLLDSGCEIPNH